MGSLFAYKKKIEKLPDGKLLKELRAAQHLISEAGIDSKHLHHLVLMWGEVFEEVQRRARLN